MVSRRLDLLRLDYAFAVIVPCLLAIYLNDLKLLAHLDIILGFGFFVMTGCVMNDAIDRRDPREIETIERTKDFVWKELAALAIVCFAFGFGFMIRTVLDHPLNGLLLLVAGLMIVAYNLKKSIPILNQLLLAISHLILPYLVIKVDGTQITSMQEFLDIPLLSSGEWFFMIAMLFFAISAESVHEIIDGDAMNRYSPRTQQWTVLLSTGFTMIFGILAIIFTQNEVFLVFLVIPLGIIYLFRKPVRPHRGVKDIGIIMGNMVMVALVALILRQNYLP
ncbi:MAG: hypothetical protein ACTSWW_03495 [Promethearchaeota archaeon]